MGLLSIFGKKDFTAGMAQYEADPGAVLLVVRTEEEHLHLRIPGSRNLPLDEIGKAKFVVPDVTTPVYVYCRSGVRSRQAASVLKKLGYTNVYDIGGIKGYQGRTEGGPK